MERGSSSKNVKQQQHADSSVVTEPGSKASGSRVITSSTPEDKHPVEHNQQSQGASRGGGDNDVSLDEDSESSVDYSTYAITSEEEEKPAALASTVLKQERALLKESQEKAIEELTFKINVVRKS